MDKKATKRDNAIPAETHTVAEAATRLGLSRSKAYEMIADGSFPAPVIRLGRKIVIPIRAIDRLLAEGSDGQSHAPTDDQGMVAQSD